MENPQKSPAPGQPGGRLNDPSIRLWDLGKGRPLRAFAGVEKPVHGVAFSPDGRLAVSGGSYGILQLWDVATGRQLRCMQPQAPATRCPDVHAVSFSPDGRQMLSGSEDGTVQLWDAASGTMLYPFRGHTSRVWWVAFSADGRRALSTAGDWQSSGFRLGDYQFGEELPFDQPVRRSKVPFFDCTVRIWDVATGTELRRFDGQDCGARN